MLLALLTALAPIPQDPPTTGFLMDKPIGLLDQAQGSDLVMTDADGTTVPMSTYHPTLSITQLVPLTASSGLRINSFSRGTGAMYSVLQNGEVSPDVGLNGWSFFLFSVSGTTWPADTPYALEPSVEGDVFSYIIEGSDGAFPLDEVGTLHKIREGNQLGVTRLAGIDSYVPGYALGASYITEYEEVESPPRRPFYFTLYSSTGDYTVIDDDWVGGDASLKKPSTIFEVLLEGGVTSTPHVYLSGVEIGLDPDDVVDALSVMSPSPAMTVDGAPGMRVLVGVDTPEAKKKLHVYGHWYNDATPSVIAPHHGPLYDGSGGLFVETKLRIGRDGRVRASCGDDPLGDAQPTNPRGRLHRTRTALVDGEAIGSFPGSLDYSMHQLRRLQPTATPRYRVALRGFVGQTDLYAKLMMWDTGFDDPGASANSVSVGYVMRNPNAADGDKRFLDFDIPSPQSPTDMRLQWWVMSTSGVVGKSMPFVILAR